MTLETRVARIEALVSQLVLVLERRPDLLAEIRKELARALPKAASMGAGVVGEGSPQQAPRLAGDEPACRKRVKHG